jgi:hypothetical protein
MTMSNKPLLGAGVKQISVIALDPANAEETIALAKHVAERMGHTVTVRDFDGEILEFVRGASKN